MPLIIPTHGLNSPAAVEMGRCNRILVDPIQWPFIPSAQKQFIIEHELAHCLYDIEDETEADRVGFSRFVADGGDPQDAYEAITNNLDMRDPRNQSRADLIYQQVESMRSNRIRTFGPDFEGGNYGSYGDPATPQPDPTGWGFDEWNKFLGTLGGLAPDVINAARGQSGYKAPPMGDQDDLGGSPTDWTSIGLIGGGLLLLIILIALILKK